LNPDDVARDRFGDWNSPEAVLQAAEWTRARREELLAAGAGIADAIEDLPRHAEFVDLRAA
jgi:hypothetical protein